MEPKVSYPIVGLFVVLLGASLLAVVIWLSKSDYRAAYERYHTYMGESVSGLSIDSSVKYHGVDVGRVKEIVLSPENPAEVRLLLEIIRGTPVKTDTVALLDTQGLTGLTTVNLRGGTREAPLLAAAPGEQYPVIKSAPSLFSRLEASVSRLLAEEHMPRLLANLDGLTDDARGVVDKDNRAALKQVLADLAVVTRTLATRRTELDQSVVRAAAALENFSGVSKKISEQLPEIMERTSSAMRSFQEAVDGVARTSASVQSVLDGNRSDIEQFTGHTLAEAALLVSEVRQLAVTLQRLAKELEAEPSLLVFGRPRQPLGPGE